MDRGRLDALSREELIGVAEGLGVLRANVLTRAELVDEIVRTTTTDPERRSLARGLLGVARDLIANVVQRGLNLPDAVDRLRRARSMAGFESDALPIPTVTLAQIYEDQGLRDRALAVLDDLLAAEPVHEAARALRSKIVDTPARFAAAPRENVQLSALPLAAESASSSEEREPEHSREHRLVALRRALAIDLSWDLVNTRSDLYELGENRVLSVRAVIVTASWNGPASRSIDHVANGPSGTLTIRDVPAHAFVRAAVGIGEGSRFVPLAVVSLDPTGAIVVMRNGDGPEAEGGSWPPDPSALGSVPSRLS